MTSRPPGRGVILAGHGIHRSTFPGPLSRLDRAARRVWHAGREATLTSTEYSLLDLLLRNVNKVLTHRFILESVWGGEYSTEKEYVRAYVYRLRTKLNLDQDGCAHILSMPGVGYMLRSSDADKPPAESVSGHSTSSVAT